MSRTDERGVLVDLGQERPQVPARARNLSPSYRFQYQVTYAGSQMNLDSAEYANMTLHFIAWYEQALRAGMRPLPQADMRVLRGIPVPSSGAVAPANPWMMFEQFVNFLAGGLSAS